MGVLTWQTFAYVSAGAFMGGIAAGGAGFAFSLVATSIWLHVLDPLHSTVLTVACGTILHVGLIWPLRRSVDKQRLWPFLIGGLCGIPLGVMMLGRFEPGATKIALGLFLAGYGIYALARPQFPRMTIGGQPADAAVGFVGGVLGGFSGYNGVLPTIWTQLRGWPRNEARAVYQPYVFVTNIVMVIMISIAALDRTGVLLIAAALPALAAGGLTGWLIYGRLDERRFRQVLAVLLIAAGAPLVL